MLNIYFKDSFSNIDIVGSLKFWPISKLNIYFTDSFKITVLNLVNINLITLFNLNLFAIEW